MNGKEPVFIVAGDIGLAASAAMDLGLPHSPNTPMWRYLGDPRILRGRRSVRICYGYFRPEDDLRALEEIEHIVRTMERRLPGSVEVVEIPKDPA